MNLDRTSLQSRTMSFVAARRSDLEDGSFVLPEYGSHNGLFSCCAATDEEDEIDRGERCYWDLWFCCRKCGCTSESKMTRFLIIALLAAVILLAIFLGLSRSNNNSSPTGPSHQKRSSDSWVRTDCPEGYSQCYQNVEAEKSAYFAAEGTVDEMLHETWSKFNNSGLAARYESMKTDKGWPGPEIGCRLMIHPEEPFQDPESSNLTLQWTKVWPEGCPESTQTKAPMWAIVHSEKKRRSLLEMEPVIPEESELDNRIWALFWWILSAALFICFYCFIKGYLKHRNGREAFRECMRSLLPCCRPKPDARFEEMTVHAEAPLLSPAAGKAKSDEDEDDSGLYEAGSGSEEEEGYMYSSGNEESEPEPEPEKVVAPNIVLPFPIEDSVAIPSLSRTQYQP